MFEIAYPSLENVPQMAALHVRCWQQAYRGIFPDSVLDNLSIAKRAEGWTRTLSDPETFSPAARVDGQWVGFMHCGPTRQKQGDSEVYGIYVDQGHHRQGIGRHLMTLAFSNLRQRGYSSMVLRTITSNHRARRFYEAMGGRVMADGVTFMIEGIEYPEVMYRFEL